jgi:hypothetical protein
MQEGRGWKVWSLALSPLIVALSLIHGGSHFGLDGVEIIMIYWNFHLNLRHM